MGRRRLARRDAALEFLGLKWADEGPLVFCPDGGRLTHRGPGRARGAVSCRSSSSAPSFWRDALFQARAPNRSNRYASSGPPRPLYASRAMASEKGKICRSRRPSDERTRRCCSPKAPARHPRPSTCCPARRADVPTPPPQVASRAVPGRSSSRRSCSRSEELLDHLGGIPHEHGAPGLEQPRPHRGFPPRWRADVHP